MCGFVDGATILTANYRLDPNLIDQSQVVFGPVSSVQGASWVGLFYFQIVRFTEAKVKRTINCKVKGTCTKCCSIIGQTAGKKEITFNLS